MTLQELLKQIRENFHEAELDQLETWLSSLTVEYAFLAENIGEVKKNQALMELEIKKKLIEEGEKPTEKEIERRFYATSEGQFLALNTHLIKAVSKFISSIRFKIDAMRGNIN